MDWVDGGYQKKLDDLVDAAIRQQEHADVREDGGFGWTAADTRDTRGPPGGGRDGSGWGVFAGGENEPPAGVARGSGRHEKSYWEGKHAAVGSVGGSRRGEITSPVHGVDIVRRELQKEKKRAQADRARKDEDKRSRDLLWRKVLHNRQNDPSAPHRLLQQHRLSSTGYMQPAPSPDVTSPPSSAPPPAQHRPSQQPPQEASPPPPRAPTSQNGRIRPDVLCGDRAPYHHRLAQSPRQSPPRPDPAWLLASPPQVVDHAHLYAAVSAQEERVPGWLADPPPPL